MLACQNNVFLRVMLEHVNACGVTNFFRYANNWRIDGVISNDLWNYSPNRCAMLDEVIVAITRPQSKKIVFQLLEVFA